MRVVAAWRDRSASALRSALRMSGDEFAAYLGVSSRGVAKWEAQPETELAIRTQQLLDIALKHCDEDAKERFTQLLAAASEDSPPAKPATPAVVPDLAMSLNGGPRKATPELVGSLRRALRDHYTADNLLGPRALLPVITSYADTVEQVRRTASGRLLDDLLQVGAGYAEFAGWLYQDSGDIDAATRWYRRALEWAETGGDDRMAAFVLTRRAVQAIGLREGEYAARLARAAQRSNSPMTARVRALAAQTEAVGHAIHGDAGEVDRALDLAADLVNRADDPADGDPSEGRYCHMHLYLKISRAKCQLELGRAEEAIDAFTEVLNALPPHYHRDRGQYLARLAHAYVLARCPDEACLHAEESFAIALTTGSSRTVADLRELLAKLEPWADTATVVRFREMLAAATQTV